MPAYVVHPGDVRLPLGEGVTALPFAERSLSPSCDAGLTKPLPVIGCRIPGPASSRRTAPPPSCTPFGLTADGVNTRNSLLNLGLVQKKSCIIQSFC